MSESQRDAPPRRMHALAGRRRAAFGLAAVAAAALLAGVLCARADDEPADDAARLVPSGALVYVHLSTDPDRDPDARLAELVERLPALARLRDRVAGGIATRPLDLERDVRPWLGDELAYAAVSPADSVVLAAVADRGEAQALVDRIGDLDAAERYQGVPVLVVGPTAVAFVGEFLAVGTEAAVHAAVDRDQGAGEPLSELPAYRRATADRPEERSLDAYASAAGVRTLLAQRDGPLGVLGALLDRPGLTAAGASLTAEGRGLRARVRLAGGAPRDAAFEPMLLERVPEAAAAYAGIRSALRIGRVLGRLGLPRPLGRLGDALADDAGIELERDLLAPLSGELAIAVTRAESGIPVVTLKARTADPRRTGSALGRLQEPLARRLAVPGTVPAFQTAQIGGVEAFTLRVTPELAPSYAVADRSVVISTTPSGLEPPRGTLAAAPAFDATIGEVPDRADSLVFLDLRALLALGEQTGLTAIPGLAAARDDLSRVRAAGAVIAADPAHPSDTTAELFLEIP